jgi:hypothetical protein
MAFLPSTTTSAQTFAYFVPGLNMIPAFNNSPQFFSLAISKSNLLLAAACCINAMLAAAASLHWSCNFLSNGEDQVAEKPMPRL